MHTFALNGVEVSGKCGNQSLAFTGAHFGDFTAVKDDAADHLHIEMAHTKCADRCFAYSGKGFGENVVKRFASRQPITEELRLGFQLFIGKRRDAVF